MRDAILARNKDHARRANLACRTCVVSCPAVDVYSLLGTAIDLHRFTHARDAIRMKRDRRTVECFDPIHLTPLLAFLRRNPMCSRLDLTAERSQSVRRRMPHIEREKHMASTGIDAAWR